MISWEGKLFSYICYLAVPQALGHSPQILELGHLIEYFLRNSFMEKVYRKSTLKTSLVPLFVFSKRPRQLMHVRDFWKQNSLKESMNKLTWFVPLQVLFFLMEKTKKNKKCLELVTSLSLSCKTYLEKLLFWSDQLNLENVERKGKYDKILKKQIFW